MEERNKYSTKWSSDTPGYIIFLVDQSGTMDAPYTKEKNKANFTAKVINQTIYGLAKNNQKGLTIKNRAYISIIGYGGSGGNNIDPYAECKSLSELYSSPLKIEKIYGGDGRDR